MVAEFEADLARMRTGEGMRIAQARGRLKGRQPKLSRLQEARLPSLVDAGQHTVCELEGGDVVRPPDLIRAIGHGGPRPYSPQVITPSRGRTRGGGPRVRVQRSA